MFHNPKLDLQTIYVDLEKTTPAGRHILDSHGAVVCNNHTGYGNKQYQLTFSEMQSYLKFRCNQRRVIFKLKNKITISDVTDIPHYTLFNVNTKSDITIENQLENQSFVITITAANLQGVSITLFNSNLNITNMDLEYTQRGYLRFNAWNDIDSTTTNILGNIQFRNELNLTNCRFWLAEPAHSVIFTEDGDGDGDVTVTNVAVIFSWLVCFNVKGCIFNNKSNDDSDTAIVIEQPTDTYSNDISFSNKFVGNIFVNIFEFYSKISIYNNYHNKVLVFNVFTGDEEDFKDATPNNKLSNFVQRAEVNANNSYNQFGLSDVPSVCDDSLDSATNSDFLYTEWAGIDYSYMANMDENDIESFNILLRNLEAYGIRDGIGALWFNPMPDNVTISITPSIGTQGDTIELENSDTAFDTTYMPSSYVWTIEDTEDTEIISTSGCTTYDVEGYGVLPIRVDVYSPNLYYSINGSGFIRSKVDSADVLFDVRTLDNEEHSLDSFTVGQQVIIRVENQTNVENVILSVVLEVNNQQYNITNNVQQYEDYGDNIIIFDKISDLTALCKVTTIDGLVYYFSKNFSVVANTGNTYYVDLSKEYDDENWLILANGIYDDFEDQNISNDFNVGFRNYSVVNMYDEYVATGTDDVSIMSGIMNGNYIVEWSFVRTIEDDKPKIILNMDGDDFEIGWDFISDRIITNFQDKKQSHVYGVFNKDLNCPTLNTLYMKATYDGDDITITYSIDNGDTYKTCISYNDIKYTTMIVRTQCGTGSGLGYIGIQADNVKEGTFNGDGKGSQLYPLTYGEMMSRITINGSGQRYDRYMCKNSRTISGGAATIDNDNEYHINAWDSTLYGPWMLEFNNFKSHIDFAGTTLSNGIMYNSSVHNNYDLYITNMYDMIVTWNGSNNKIVFVRMRTQYTNGDYRSNIIGCTIKSAGGYATTIKGEDN